MIIPFNEKHKVNILYKNWQNEIVWRKIIPISVTYKKTKWHPEEQWILNAFDTNKQEHRCFAMKDIKEWISEKDLIEMKKAQ